VSLLFYGLLLIHDDHRKSQCLCKQKYQLIKVPLLNISNTNNHHYLCLI